MNKDSDTPRKAYSFPSKVVMVVAVVIAAVLLTLLFGYVFKVLLFVLAAILMAGFFRGIARSIRKRTSISMTWSIVIALLLTGVVVVAINWFLAPRVARQATQMTQQLPEAVQSTRQYLQHHWWGREVIQKLPDDPQQFIVNHGSWAQQTFGLLSSTFGVLSDIYIIVLIGLFLMFEPTPYVNGLVSLVPESSQERSREVISEVYTILQRWLVGKLLSMLVVAVLTAIGLYLLGMPMVLFLSILAGLLAFIPNFGPIISLIPAMLVAMLQSPAMVVYVIGVYIAVQAVESNLITPFIQRKMVYLPLAMIIIAQVVLGFLVGGLGLIFATPIVAVIMVLVRMLYIEDTLGQEVVHSE